MTLLLAVGGLTGLRAVRAQATVEKAENAANPRMEYKVSDNMYRTHLQNYLHGLANEGWELDQLAVVNPGAAMNAIEAFVIVRRPVKRVQ